MKKFAPVEFAVEKLSNCRGDSFEMNTYVASWLEVIGNSDGKWSTRENFRRAARRHLTIRRQIVGGLIKARRWMKVKGKSGPRSQPLRPSSSIHFYLSPGLKTGRQPRPWLVGIGNRAKARCQKLSRTYKDAKHQLLSPLPSTFNFRSFETLLLPRLAEPNQPKSCRRQTR